MMNRTLQHSCNLVFSALFVSALAGCSSFEVDQKTDETALNTSAEKSEAIPSFSKADQSPGFFRMKLGEYTITSLYDGYVELNGKLFKGRSASAITNLLKQSRQSQSIYTSINAFLLDDGKQLVLIDAGGSAALSASMGKLLSSLKMSGYDPEDVSVILLTHLHPDHIGALAQDGKMTFPNAHVYVSEAEAAHWLAPSRSNGELPYFQGAQQAIAPYQQASQFHTLTSQRIPVAGVQMVNLPGHTPGHLAYRVNSGTESLLFWGDVVHNFALQFTDPAIYIDFDQESKKARASRTKILQDAQKSGEWIAGAHMPFPGIGQVLAAGKNSYRWLPIDYSRALNSSPRETLSEKK